MEALRRLRVSITSRYRSQPNKKGVLPLRHRTVAARLESLQADQSPVTIRVRNARAAITFDSKVRGTVTFDERKKCHVIKLPMGKRVYRLKTSTILSIDPSSSSS